MQRPKRRREFKSLKQPQEYQQSVKKESLICRLNVVKKCAAKMYLHFVSTEISEL